MSKLPAQKDLVKWTLQALRDGEALNVSELCERIYLLSNLDRSSFPQRSEKDRRNTFEYKLAWTRTYCADLGYIKRVERKWQITKEGMIQIDKQ